MCWDFEEVRESRGLLEALQDVCSPADGEDSPQKECCRRFCYSMRIEL